MTTGGIVGAVGGALAVMLVVTLLSCKFCGGGVDGLSPAQMSAQRWGIAVMVFGCFGAIPIDAIFGGVMVTRSKPSGPGVFVGGLSNAVAAILMIAIGSTLGLCCCGSLRAENAEIRFTTTFRLAVFASILTFCGVVSASIVCLAFWPLPLDMLFCEAPGCGQVTDFMQGYYVFRLGVLAMNLLLLVVATAKFRKAMQPAVRTSKMVVDASA